MSNNYDYVINTKDSFIYVLQNPSEEDLVKGLDSIKSYIGFIEDDKVYSSDNKLIGYVKDNNIIDANTNDEIYNQKGILYGKIDSNSIYDLDKIKIGYIQGDIIYEYYTVRQYDATKQDFVIVKKTRVFGYIKNDNLNYAKRTKRELVRDIDTNFVIGYVKTNKAYNAESCIGNVYKTDGKNQKNIVNSEGEFIGRICEENTMISTKQNTTVIGYLTSDETIKDFDNQIIGYLGNGYQAIYDIDDKFIGYIVKNTDTIIGYVDGIKASANRLIKFTCDYNSSGTLHENQVFVCTSETLQKEDFIFYMQNVHNIEIIENTLRQEYIPAL